MSTLDGALQRFNEAIDALEAGLRHQAEAAAQPAPIVDPDAAAVEEIGRLRAREADLSAALRDARAGEDLWSREARAASEDLSAAIREIKVLLEG